MHTRNCEEKVRIMTFLHIHILPFLFFFYLVVKTCFYRILLIIEIKKTLGMLINCQFFMFEFHLIVNFDIYNHSSLFLNINKHDFHLKKKKH